MGTLFNPITIIGPNGDFETMDALVDTGASWRRYLWLAAAATLTVILAACSGGGGDDGPAADGALTPGATVTSLPTAEPTATPKAACGGSLVDEFMADLDAIILEFKEVQGEQAPADVDPGIEYRTWLHQQQYPKVELLRTRAKLLNSRGCGSLDELRSYATFMIGGWEATLLEIWLDPEEVTKLPPEQRPSTQYAESDLCRASGTTWPWCLAWSEQEYLRTHRELESGSELP